MNELAFSDLIEETYNQIEEAIDESGEDVDCENTGGVLTLVCENGSSIIFSRQLATKELWIAARSGGFHLSWKDSIWYCEKHEQTLQQLFATITKEQVGEAIELG